MTKLNKVNNTVRMWTFCKVSRENKGIRLESRRSAWPDSDESVRVGFKVDEEMVFDDDV